MLTIDNLESWTENYFSKEENQKKAEKACEHYDRLIIKQIRKQMLSGTEQIQLSELEDNDPGKCLENAKYEIIPSAIVDGKKGQIRINLLDRTAEFLEKIQK